MHAQHNTSNQQGMLPHADAGLTSLFTWYPLQSYTLWTSFGDVMSITDLPAVHSQIMLYSVWNVLFLTHRLEANVSSPMLQQNLPQLNLLSTHTCLWQLRDLFCIPVIAFSHLLEFNHCSTWWKISLSKPDSSHSLYTWACLNSAGVGFATN